MKNFIKLIVIILTMLTLASVCIGCQSVSASPVRVHNNTVLGVVIENMEWYEEVDNDTFKLHMYGFVTPTKQWVDIPIYSVDYEQMVACCQNALEVHVVYYYEYDVILSRNDILSGKKLPEVTVLQSFYNNLFSPIIIEKYWAEADVSIWDINEAESRAISTIKSHTWDNSVTYLNHGMQMENISICREVKLRRDTETSKFYFDVVGITNISAN